MQVGRRVMNYNGRYPPFYRKLQTALNFEAIFSIREAIKKGHGPD
jgi:hypothetical protein